MSGTRINRFSWGERALHWLLAGSFFVMLGSGLVLMVPALSGVAARPVAKQWHLGAAWVLAVGAVLLFAVHGRRLRGTVRQLEVMSPNDLRWLREAPRRLRGVGAAPPQGRFNAGQKLNSALVAGLMAVAYLTGLLLWLGERDNELRFAGTVIVHDWTMWLLGILVAGHLYMALVHRPTRPALRGMVLGDVDREWAAEHHAEWVAQIAPSGAAEEAQLGLTKAAELREVDRGGVDLP